MSVKASVKNLPIPPRKARLITDLVRGKSVESASSMLRMSSKKGAGQVLKLVKSAAANAVNNFDLDKNNLYIKGIQAQEGLVLKRWTPRAHGRATPVLKRRTHILIELDEIKQTKKEQKGRKSKMRTVSYEDLKKSLEEAKKTVSKVKKDQPRPATEEHKEIDSKPRFSRLGDKFKSVLRSRDKKV